MNSIIHSAALRAHSAIGVEVRVCVSKGEQSRVDLVGLPAAAVRETSQRMLSALRASTLPLLGGTYTVKLIPTELTKTGPAFDLPIALALAAAAPDHWPTAEDCCIVGELAPDGSVRGIKGAIAIALEAKRQGRTRIIAPESNVQEAALVEGIDVFGVRSLRQAWRFLRGEEAIPPASPPSIAPRPCSHSVDFNEIEGFAFEKRALEIAAAGGHHLIFMGPDAAAMAKLAERVVTILPEMTEREILETTQIYSVTGQLDPGEGIVCRRPFRAPCYTLSDAAMFGGGNNPGVGEASLAHNGVMFLNRLQEFTRPLLEQLSQALIHGTMEVSKEGQTLSLPAKFHLICAMDSVGVERATGSALPQPDEAAEPDSQDHRQNPLYPHWDLQVECGASSRSTKKNESSATIWQRISAARGIQATRFGTAGFDCNASIPKPLIGRYCTLIPEAAELLDRAVRESNLSEGAQEAVLRVARTIADLGGHETLEEEDVSEALRCRPLAIEVGS